MHTALHVQEMREAEEGGTAGSRRGRGSKGKKKATGTRPPIALLDGYNLLHRSATGTGTNTGMQLQSPGRQAHLKCVDNVSSGSGATVLLAELGICARALLGSAHLPA
jgi:hypothetical protein